MPKTKTCACTCHTADERFRLDACFQCVHRHPAPMPRPLTWKGPLGWDAEGFIVFRNSDGMDVRLTPCCRATAKGLDDCVGCRSCYREIDPEIGCDPVLPYTDVNRDVTAFESPGNVFIMPFSNRIIGPRQAGRLPVMPDPVALKVDVTGPVPTAGPVELGVEVRDNSKTRDWRPAPDIPPAKVGHLNACYGWAKYRKVGVS